MHLQQGLLYFSTPYLCLPGTAPYPVIQHRYFLVFPLGNAPGNGASFPVPSFLGAFISIGLCLGEVGGRGVGRWETAGGRGGGRSFTAARRERPPRSERGAVDLPVLNGLLYLLRRNAQRVVLMRSVLCVYRSYPLATKHKLFCAPDTSAHRLHALF